MHLSLLKRKLCGRAGLSRTIHLPYQTFYNFQFFNRLHVASRYFALWLWGLVHLLMLAGSFLMAWVFDQTLYWVLTSGVTTSIPQKIVLQFIHLFILSTMNMRSIWCLAQSSVGFHTQSFFMRVFPFKKILLALLQETKLETLRLIYKMELLIN